MSRNGRCGVRNEDGPLSLRRLGFHSLRNVTLGSAGQGVWPAQNGGLAMWRVASNRVPFSASLAIYRLIRADYV